MFRKKKLAVFLAVLLAFPVFGETVPKMNLNINRKSAVLKIDEPVEFSAEFASESKDWNGKVKTTLTCNGKTVETKEFNSGDKITQTAKSSEPASIIWTVQPLNSDGKPFEKWPNSFSYGIVVDPFSIYPASARPADFEQRWADEIAELRKIPMNGIKWIEWEGKTFGDGKKKFRIVEVSIPMGNDVLPVTGILVFPLDAKDKSLKLDIRFPGANYFPFNGACPGGDRRSMDRIIFDFNPHGLPIQDGIKNGDYYVKNYSLKKGGYGCNPWGMDGEKPVDFKKCYYRTVILRMIRALDYLKTLPQWDGKNLKAEGGSQGGALGLIAAALDPDVTETDVWIPALCDHSAPLAGRSTGGWPQISRLIALDKLESLATDWSYLDVSHFTPMIKCPVSIRMGMVDPVCPPASVFSAINGIPATTPKKIVMCREGGHEIFGKNVEILVDTLPKTEKME